MCIQNAFVGAVSGRLESQISWETEKHRGLEGWDRLASLAVWLTYGGSENSQPFEPQLPGERRVAPAGLQGRCTDQE